MAKHQQRTAEIYWIKIPVHIEVRLAQDGSFVSQQETIIEWLLPSEDIDRLKQDINDVLHSEFTASVAIYVHEKFFPPEASETYGIFIYVKGNIDTWEREPYLTN
jgi:hypothetical protein